MEVESRFAAPESRQILKHFRLRRGMWVTCRGAVGILHEVAPQSSLVADVMGEVHLVDSLGLTIEKIIVPLNSLNQAAWDQIPEPRRPTREAGLMRGYR